MLRRLRLLLVVGIAGVLTGIVSWTFLEALNRATAARLDHPWLLWVLPAAGVLTAGAYHYLGGHAKGGTPYVIEQGHVLTHGVPARMTPLVWLGSTLGHLTGASVGREGAALQIAGSITDSAARAARLGDDERRVLITASLAAGWGGVFGVPLTGLAFALQMSRSHRRHVLIPAVVSALAARWAVSWFDPSFGVRPHLPATDWSVGLPITLLALGVTTGLAARVFVGGLHRTRRVVARHVRWHPIRPLVGVAITWALVALVGRSYLGLSTGLLEQSFTGSGIDLWDPLLKLLFTIAALGTGFVGGEVLPLFVIGGTLGAALATPFGGPAVLLAATGSVAAFSSAAGTVLTGLVLTVEQFGWHGLLPALLVGLGARLAAGRPGLYATHH